MTRKNTMIKMLKNAESDEMEMFKLCGKFFNELANDYFFEHEEVTFDEEKNVFFDTEHNKFDSILDFYNEICYWLSCYYEGGNIRHDEEYNDRKAFIRFLEVFKPYVGKTNNHWLSYIPWKEETKFLFA